MTTKLDRHKSVEVSCEWCGEIFRARKERVDKGQSRFCSREHHREWLTSIGSQRKNIGKEKAIIQWDKSKNMFCAYWYDENMQYHSAGWARWAWELSFGEIPSGYYASYKDGNSTNAVLENVCLKTMNEISGIGERNKGVPKTAETRRKLSISHTGKTLSESHKNHIAESNSRKWAEGVFDKVHKGKYNSHWRGGVKKGYPKEFGDIREFIRSRDRFMCQICGKALHKTRDSHVHHKSGNRRDNSQDNLILLCTSCHGKIHSNQPAPPAILAFRARLEWNL